MSLSKKASSRIWEIILADALEESCRNEVLEFESLEAEPHIFSKKFEKNIRKIIRSIGRKDTVKITIKVVSQVVAVIMLVMGITFSFLLTDSEVFAVVKRTLREIFYNKDEYSFDDITADYGDFYFYKQLGYVPDGYEWRSVNFSKFKVVLLYENTSNDEQIVFEYSKSNGSYLLLDNENRSFIVIENNNQEYYFYEAESGYNKLVWIKNEYYYVVSAKLNKDIIIEMAENVK